MATKKRKVTHCLVCEAVVDDSRPYYRRYRTCHICATAERVMLHEEPHRFCQQCGKYEKLDVFEGQARTCRVALARHSERRRNATLQRKRKKMEQQASKLKNEPYVFQKQNLNSFPRIKTMTPIPLRLYPEDINESSLARKIFGGILARLSIEQRFPRSLPPQTLKYSAGRNNPVEIGSIQSRLSNMSDSESIAIERGLLALLQSMGGVKQ